MINRIKPLLRWFAGPKEPSGDTPSETSSVEFTPRRDLVFRVAIKGRAKALFESTCFVDGKLRPELHASLVRLVEAAVDVMLAGQVRKALEDPAQIRCSVHTN